MITKQRHEEINKAGVQTGIYQVHRLVEMNIIASVQDLSHKIKNHTRKHYRQHHRIKAKEKLIQPINIYIRQLLQHNNKKKFLNQRFHNNRLNLNSKHMSYIRPKENHWRNREVQLELVGLAQEREKRREDRIKNQRAVEGRVQMPR